MTDLVDKLRGQYIEATNRVKALKDLVLHCWIHSSYKNCGFKQMTKEQKRLYESLTGYNDPNGN